MEPNRPLLTLPWGMGVADILQIVVLLAFEAVIYLISGHFDLLERFSEFSARHETWEMDELFSVGIFSLLVVTVLLFRKTCSLRRLRSELFRQNERLQVALAEIKQLAGLIPICCHCKKIRDDAGYWHQVEAYIQHHTDARFSHGICPDCQRHFYPDLFDPEEKGDPEEGATPQHQKGA
jgi:hypothetical protein